MLFRAPMLERPSVCALGHPSDAGHVLEPGREDQHFCEIPPEQSQAGPGLIEDRGVNGKHGPGGFTVLGKHFVCRSCSLFLF